MQVYPSSYIKTPGGWDSVLQPVSLCGLDTLHTSNLSALPRLNAGRSTDNAALEVFMPIIDNGVSQWDPPALPNDVLEAASLFNSRPEIW